MSHHVNSVQRYGALALIGLAVVGAAACSDVLAPGNGQGTTLTFRSSTRAPSGSVASLAMIPVTGGGHTVDVQKVDVLFDQVKLERVHTGDERDSDANEEDSDLRNEEVFRSGPVTIALPLDGGSVSPFTQALPVGLYDELQMKARSLRLQGTYDGQTFDVTVPVDVKLETRLNPPLNIAAATDRPDITVDVNVLSWFKASDGTVIDPRLLATDGSLRSAFRSRVRSSFRAFKDKNRDGVDSDSR